MSKCYDLVACSDFSVTQASRHNETNLLKDRDRLMKRPISNRESGVCSILNSCILRKMVRRTGDDIKTDKKNC